MSTFPSIRKGGNRWALVSPQRIPSQNSPNIHPVGHVSWKILFYHWATTTIKQYIAKTTFHFDEKVSYKSENSNFREKTNRKIREILFTQCRSPSLLILTIFFHYKIKNSNLLKNSWNFVYKGQNTFYFDYFFFHCKIEIFGKMQYSRSFFLRPFFGCLCQMYWSVNKWSALVVCGGSMDFCWRHGKSIAWLLYIPAAWGYHRQGYCQAGFSAVVSNVSLSSTFFLSDSYHNTCSYLQDRLYIGSPGSWYWQGKTTLIKIHLFVRSTMFLLQVKCIPKIFEIVWTCHRVQKVPTLKIITT